MKRILPYFITVFVFYGLAYFPVVPIQKAPVLPDQVYTLGWVDFREIISFAINQWDGISYKYPWYTYAVLLGLLVVGCLVSWLAFRILRGASTD